MILSTAELGWAVRKQFLLQSISMQVKTGETMGLIGPNGSGKSSLLRLLAGIQKPTCGQVHFRGRLLSELTQREIAQKIAFMEQHADTCERICVRDAVELGRTPWLSALRPWSDQDEAIVVQAMADAGISHLQQRLWYTLSGGERQRVHLARALAQQPSILLLDEPTNHLDIQHQISILKLVSDLAVTTIAALHDLNQAMICDRLAVMNQGKLIALGPPTQVLTHELIHDCFAVNVRTIVDPVDNQAILRFFPL